MEMNLSQKTATEILQIYNSVAVKLGRKTVTRFSDLKTAIRRTTDILTAVDNFTMLDGRTVHLAQHVKPGAMDGLPILATVPVVYQPLGETEVEQLELSKSPANKRRGYNFDPKSVIKKLNQGTTRALVAELLRAGATEEAVTDLVDARWREIDEKKGLKPRSRERILITTYEYIRVLHTYDGYGLVERDGKIFLLGEPTV